jgi:hypothetical protein
MASDRGTVAMITATNAKLVSQLEAAQSYINTLKEKCMAGSMTDQVGEQQ